MFGVEGRKARKLRDSMHVPKTAMGHDATALLASFRFSSGRFRDGHLALLDLFSE
jgi:hypothetical protein